MTKMELALQSVSDGHITFPIRREDGSTEEVTIMPMYKFVFPEKISQKELESQVKEILLGQRKANGPVEYKIVPKNIKSNALLLADKDSIDSGIVINSTSYVK